MPRHKIVLKQPASQALNSDISFDIYSNESLLGELKISKGSIDWRAASQRSAKKMTWEEFARLVAAD